MSLQVDFVKMFVQSTFGEQSGIRSAAMLFHKVKAKVGVFAKWVICLFGERKIARLGNDLSVNVISPIFSALAEGSTSIFPSSTND